MCPTLGKGELIMDNGQKTESREFKVLPPEITRQYPGMHIVFSEDQQRVIGAGKTAEDASAQAHASGVGGLWHFAYAFHPNELIV
jgi:hypothetical protein